ncbi:MAG: hypothetical protein AAF738_07335, partial [Bacteroidota bacterium]
STLARKPKTQAALLPTLDQSLDVALDKLKWEGEDLVEEEYWTEKWWLEVREIGAKSNVQILHLFKADRSYQRVIEGDVILGRWYFPVKNENRIEIQLQNGESKNLELYERSFLGEEHCLVLRKMGAQVMRGKRKYLPLVSLKTVYGKYKGDFVWTDFVQELRAEGVRYGNFYRNLVIGIIVIGTAIMLLSSFN